MSSSVSLSSLLNNFVAASAPGRKPILLLLQAALPDTLGHFMAVSFNSLLRGFRQAFKLVIMHEHQSLLHFGSIHWRCLPFFGEDTELCQDVCKFEVVVEMTAKFSVT
jgi:hypothetical protein